MNKFPNLTTLTIIFIGLSMASGGLNAQFDQYQGKTAVFVIGEREYGTPRTLPEFAKKHLEPLGINCEFVFAESDNRDSIECHTFRGLDVLDDADILILSLRRRYPAEEDLKKIRDWVESGNPVIAIRTSSHAFGEREKGEGYQAPSGHAAWNTFDRDVLGASYQGHYKEKEGEPALNVRASLKGSAKAHQLVLKLSFQDPFLAEGKLYMYTELDPQIDVLLTARYAEGEPEYPLAWTNEKNGLRVFYTSLGGVEEMALSQTQSLLKSAVLWGLDRKGNTAGSTKAGERTKEATGEGFPAVKSHSFLQPAQGLEIDLVGSEPEIKQPSFIRFDERGRLWIVQYRKYPMPAGLEIVSRDEFWRNTYDQVPAPPGDARFIPGADMITIHEDTNGDGNFDKITPFLEGLSFATSVAWDRDGVWVLQPPYLLYYKDEDQNDVVDGDPEVHLKGFGIQDSHSIANSLNWGPDGWLYGAQGSTVTASIEVVGSGEPPIKSVGQLMWRYHPKKKVYEVFSEGGGNIWSCQFDSKGRLFAGANEGRKLGYHYMQGSYNKKNFTKHGELSNPHAYGYFMGVEEPDSKRVTTNLLIYEEEALPSRYDGAILTANALAGRLLASSPVVTGPTFHASPIDVMVDSDDRWFRPVYAEVGPDGAVYVADWYDQQVNHFKNHEGRISLADGRIYRVRSEGNYQPTSIDLAELTTRELVELLKDPRRWYRDTARRLLNERQDGSELSTLSHWLEYETGQVALEALWVLNLLGEFDTKNRIIALNHKDPYVRKWGVRLIGDGRTASAAELSKLRTMAANDPHIEVRQQLASTAKRLQSPEGLTLVAELLKRDEDASDPYMPMLVWWALESFCSGDEQQVVELFGDRRLFDHAMVQSPILGFTMRRLASEGTRDYLRACAQLLKSAPDSKSRESLLAGFETAFRGRAMTGLPEELVEAVSEAGGGSLAMQIRQNIPGVFERAKVLLSNGTTSSLDRQRTIEALGEVSDESMLDTLLGQLLIGDSKTQEITLSALRSYNYRRVAERVTELYPTFSTQVQSAALTLLMSRLNWIDILLNAIKAGRVSLTSIPRESIDGMRLLADDEISAKIDQIWGSISSLPNEGDNESQRLRQVLNDKAIVGDLFQGRQQYLQRCGACHSLHNEGGAIGPELTGYQRDDRESLLLAITKPNTEIREGFENYVVRTKDGQSLAGFIADKDDHVIVLRPVGGQPVVIDQANISSIDAAGVSLMPTGLLNDLSDQELTDLFSYLQSPQPLNLK